MHMPSGTRLAERIRWRQTGPSVGPPCFALRPAFGAPQLNSRSLSRRTCSWSTPVARGASAWLTRDAVRVRHRLSQRFRLVWRDVSGGRRSRSGGRCHVAECEGLR
jgi:hypothetical protein